jgi:hypothetical protein
VGGYGLNSCHSRERSVADYYEHGNEPLGSINMGNFLTS